MNKNQLTQSNRLPQVTCYNCQPKGHVSRYFRNKKVSTPRIEDKPHNNEKPKYTGASTLQKDQNAQPSQKQQYDKSAVRQTRLTDDQTRQESDSQDEQDAFFGNVNVRINATTGESTNSGQIARAKVFNSQYKEIALVVKVNDTDATAIINTESPVTVISRGLFDRMGDEYEDNQQKVKLIIKNSSIKLFSCEADQVMNTMGECNV